MWFRARQLAGTKISPRVTGSCPRELLQRFQVFKQLTRRGSAKDQLCADGDSTQAYLVLTSRDIDGVHVVTGDTHVAQNHLHVRVADFATPAQIDTAQVAPRHARQC